MDIQATMENCIYFLLLLWHTFSPVDVKGMYIMWNVENSMWILMVISIFPNLHLSLYTRQYSVSTGTKWWPHMVTSKIVGCVSSNLVASNEIELLCSDRLERHKTDVP